MAKSPGNKKTKETSTTVDLFSFEDVDFKGWTVYLSPGRWESHIIGGPHPDLVGYEQEVKTTALDPDVVGYETPEGEPFDTEIRITRGFGRGRYKDLYLWVPIHKVKEKLWKVASAYWVPNIKPDIIRTIWRKKN